MTSSPQKMFHFTEYLENRKDYWVAFPCEDKEKTTTDSQEQFCSLMDILEEIRTTKTQKQFFFNGYAERNQDKCTKRTCTNNRGR